LEVLEEMSGGVVVEVDYRGEGDSAVQGETDEPG